MPNPNIAQGTLNRIQASVIITNIPALNITPPYMSKAFVSITPDGDFDSLIQTGTGGVSSPEPYVFYTVTIGILKTQALADAWETQANTLTDIGPFSVYPDSIALQNYNFESGIIVSIAPAPFDGTDPAMTLTLKGVRQINNQLWNL